MCLPGEPLILSAREGEKIMADDNDYPNVGNYEDLRARLFASRAEIFDRYGELFIREPRLFSAKSFFDGSNSATVARNHLSRAIPGRGSVAQCCRTGASDTAR